MKAIILRWIFIILTAGGAMAAHYLEQIDHAPSEVQGSPGSPDVCIPNTNEKNDG